MTLEQTSLSVLVRIFLARSQIASKKSKYTSSMRLLSGKKLPRFHGFKFNLASCLKVTYLVSSHLSRKTSDFYLRNSDVALIFPFITGLIAQCTCLFRFSTVVWHKTYVLAPFLSIFPTREQQANGSCNRQECFKTCKKFKEIVSIFKRYKIIFFTYR